MPLTRSAIDRFDLPINEEETKKKRGYMVFDHESGTRLSYNLAKYINQEVVGRKAYYYVISSNCACLDALGSGGRTKLGMSGGPAKSTPNFARRLDEWRTVWGPSVKLHMLILFDTVAQAKFFEKEVKELTRPLLESASNIMDAKLEPEEVRAIEHRLKTKPQNRLHEYFMLTDLRAVLDSSRAVFMRPKMRN